MAETIKRGRKTASALSPAGGVTGDMKLRIKIAWLMLRYPFARTNGRLLCRICHVEKTADDIRRVRKSDRQRDKASGAVRPKSALAGRKSPKPALTKIVLQRRSLYEPAQPQERM